MFLIELPIDLSKDLSSLFLFHLLSPLSHLLEFSFEFGLFLSAVFPQLHLLIIQPCFLIDQCRHNHYLMFFDGAFLDLSFDIFGLLLDDADLLIVLLPLIFELLKLTLHLLGDGKKLLPLLSCLLEALAEFGQLLLIVLLF